MNGYTDFHPKVVGGVLGSGSAAAIVWLLSVMHVHVSTAEAVGLVSLISAFGGWLAPILKRELPPPPTP